MHVSDSGGFAEDSEGQELADLAAARAAAIEGLRDILAGELRRGELSTACFIEIENEHHQLVDTVSFADAVRVSNEGATRIKN